MEIRSATTEDAAALALVHTTSWRDAYADILSASFLAGPIQQDRLELWTSRCESERKDQAIFLACEKSTVMGFVCAFMGDDPAFGSRIDNLHVMPAYRGKKIGEKLLRHAFEWIGDTDPGSAVYLWIFESNVAARRFYERLGGTVAERSTSAIPSADRKAVLRLVWQSASELAQAG